MDETTFHALADPMLARYFDRLEPLYESGALEELELQGGILTLLLPSGQTLLVSKHAPTRQLWLASRRAGGLHFAYDAGTQQWVLANGTTLDAQLVEELAHEQLSIQL